MSKGLKTMLFWSLGKPVIIITLLFIINFFLDLNIELYMYLAIFLGLAAGGLVFAGPLNYYISRSRGK